MRGKSVVGWAVGGLLGALVAGCGGAQRPGGRPAATGVRPVWGRWIATDATDAVDAVRSAPDGGVYAVGRTRMGAVLAKFTREGGRSWQVVLHGVAEGPRLGLAVDEAGRAIVAGGFVGRLRVGATVLNSRGRTDAFVARIDADGREAWVRQFGGAQFETAHAVALGPRGEIYVTGSYQGGLDLGAGVYDNDRNFDVWVARLGASGAPTWSTRFLDRGTTNTRGQALAVGSDGDVYVTGVVGRDVTAPEATGAATRDHAFVARITPGVGLRWFSMLGASGPTRGTSVAVAPDGRVLVAGTFEGQLALEGGGPRAEAADAFVAGYSARGARLWVRAIGSPGMDRANALAVDDDGMALVAGEVGAGASSGGVRWPGADADGFVARVDPTGVVRDEATFASEGEDGARDVWIEPGGTILVAGFGAAALPLGGEAHTPQGAGDGFVLRTTRTALGLGARGPDAPRTGDAGPLGVVAMTTPARGTSRINIRVQQEDGETGSRAFYVEGAESAIQGTTTAEGVVSFQVPSSVERVTVVIPSIEQRFEVSIGSLDPIDQRSGMTQRLRALGAYGYDDGGGDDAQPSAEEEGEMLRRALAWIQRRHDLPETGRVDDATLQALARDADGERAAE